MVAETIVETHDTTTIVFFTGNDHLEYQAGHFLTLDPHDFPELERFTAFLEDFKGKQEPPRAIPSPPRRTKNILPSLSRKSATSAAKPNIRRSSLPLLVRRLQKGRRLPITGFTGPYTLPADIESKTDTIYHVCAGSGMVPNYSIIKFCLAQRPNLNTSLSIATKPGAT